MQMVFYIYLVVHPQAKQHITHNYLKITHLQSYQYRYNLLYNINYQIQCYNNNFNRSFQLECYDEDIYPCSIKTFDKLLTINDLWKGKPFIYRNN